MKRVIFTEHDHKYMCGKKRYLSVTTLIHQYTNHFDDYKMSIYKAGKELIDETLFENMRKEIPYTELDKRVAAIMSMYSDKKALQKVALRYRNEWTATNKTACDFGTDYHMDRESESYRRMYEIHPITGKKYRTIIKEPIGQRADNWSIFENYYRLEKGFYAELLLVHHKLKLAGQADKAFISHPYASIDDYKTNKKINLYHDFAVMMKGCLSHLEDCNYNHYALQMNIYFWKLAQHGYKLGTLSLQWFGKLYQLPDMQKEVDMIMEERRVELYGKKDQLSLFKVA